MTSQGHPYAIFRRALEGRNAPAAWAAATELPHISLEDAFALCLLTAEHQPAKFDRAAGRWMRRYLQEEPRLGLAELRLTTELVSSLRGDRAAAAARTLHELFAARGRADLIRALGSLMGAN